VATLAVFSRPHGTYIALVWIPAVKLLVTDGYSDEVEASAHRSTGTTKTGFRDGSPHLNYVTHGL
jgi:hypothetical protein